ncbi:hypothetical protein GCM10027429_32470 [Marivirga atlantica]|jgi:outer membrane protein TolC|uniref:TolC family protein n=1 Tax=Marivirga atlantica TaxID=1548457 RepID=A0A937AIK1_9BACT|nr:TolC family protein [Marivirga atlantica]MBL0766823.1 TolC family protein [Marivirga atlantica]
MKRVFSAIVILTLILSNSSLAQQIDYNKIVLPESIKTADFKEKLVQLAWLNHPDNISARNQVEVAEYNLKISRRYWLDGFKLQGNLNEFNIDPERDIANRSQFLPRYNLSLTLPLGQLFYNPIENKQSAVKVTIAENDKKATMLALRKNVLAAYNDYLMYEEIFKIQSLALSDAETNHAIVEEAFKLGEETYDKYTLSLNNINQRRIAKLQAQNDMKNAKLAVEQFIGRKLEEVN